VGGGVKAACRRPVGTGFSCHPGCIAAITRHKALGNFYKTTRCCDCVIPTPTELAQLPVPMFTWKLRTHVQSLLIWHTRTAARVGNMLCR
jgi:hypothetical protein